MGRFFSGTGLEIHGPHPLTSFLQAKGTYNYLSPDRDHEGAYRINYATVGVTVHQADRLALHVLVQVNRDRASDGSRLRGNALGSQFQFNF